MAIEAVLFDYSGVLTTPLHLPTENVPYDPEAAFLEMAAALSSPDENPWHKLERGEITLEAYCDYIDQRVPGVSVLFAMASEHNIMGNLELLEDRILLARELKAGGLNVGVVTNNVAEWEPLWRPNLPSDIFDVVIDSAAVGCRKPEPEIFSMALDLMSVSDPATALFIDDFEWNVVGAADAGMAAIHCAQDTDLRAAVDGLIADRA